MANCAETRRTDSLLRQQREGAVPVVRWRILLIIEDARLIERVQIAERAGLVGTPAALDRHQRTFPITAAITGEHLDGEVAQVLEASGMGDIFAPGDGIDDLRLFLAFDHDEIE